jgi:hypothetical protein
VLTLGAVWFYGWEWSLFLKLPVGCVVLMAWLFIPRLWVAQRLVPGGTQSKAKNSLLPLHHRVEGLVDSVLLCMLLTSIGFWLDWIFYYKVFALLPVALVLLEITKKQHQSPFDPNLTDNVLWNVRNGCLYLAGTLLLYATWYSWPWFLFSLTAFYPNALVLAVSGGTLMVCGPALVSQFMGNGLLAGISLWVAVGKGIVFVYCVLCLLWYWASWLWFLVYLVVATCTCPVTVADLTLQLATDFAQRVGSIGVVQAIISYVVVVAMFASLAGCGVCIMGFSALKRQVRRAMGYPEPPEEGGQQHQQQQQQ